MKKMSKFICDHKNLILFLSGILLILSFIGMKLTRINYDILVYLPEDIETIEGQNILTDDFHMGAYSIAVAQNMDSKSVVLLEEKIKDVNGVNEVLSLYDVIGTSIPLEMLPKEITEKLHQDNTDLIFITFSGSTSSEDTIAAVEEIRSIANDKVSLGGMSSMVLDTMNLSDKEIMIYIIIAVILCILVLELSLDSYLVPILLLANIGAAILFNLGSNIFLGEISYITKALVAVLQLGVTTDFSIFLYHSYEKKKKVCKTKEDAMVDAIVETFTSVTGSSLTTIAGFLVLCTMNLSLGADLGIVMAKGVFLGVICVLTLFPSLLLVFDKVIEKTKHKAITPHFTKLNQFVVKHHIAIFVIFLLLFVPAYLAYSKVDVYYKIDQTLPDTLESIKTNKVLKEKYNIVSPEILLVHKDIKTDDVVHMIRELKEVPGIDFVLSFSDLKKLGITENMLGDDIVKIFENDEYQMILFNSLYDIASDELNEQITDVNQLIKKYDKDAIVAGEGPLMKDLIEISDTDFNNVNTSSIICIFMILILVLKSFSLPFLLICAIEFAIFMNMGISYFGGVTLPFVAPIVLGTIQLGATIDYAILMTTTYLAKRNDGIAKKEAMLDTLNYTGNSIFVSGICFFAATFGVGIYSDLEMVGSLCTLISRGAIISMVVVIMILPSILLIFDQFILKTTFHGKEKKIMKKNKMKLAKNITVWALICSLCLSSFPVSVKALVKNETVYSKLNEDGSTKSTLVNEFLLNKDNLDIIEDNTTLEDIVNMNSDHSYTIDQNNIVWNANGDDILYQGTTSKALPVQVKAHYQLDHQEMSVKDMLGKSGKVKITLTYQNQDRHQIMIQGKNETLYTPFFVTVGTILDSKNNRNITVNHGKVMNNGMSQLIVGLATPGLYESFKISELKGFNTITIEYDTTSFELPSIYSVITPKVISTDDLQFLKKLDGVYEKVDLLQENMNKMEEGSKQVLAGSHKLATSLATAIKDLENDTTDAFTKDQIQVIQNQVVQTIEKTFTTEYQNQIAQEAWKEVSKNLNGSHSDVVDMVKDSVSTAVIEYLNSVNEYEDYVNCEVGKTILAQGGQMSIAQQNSCMVIQNDQTLPFVQKAATTASSTVATEVSNYVAKMVSEQVAIRTAQTTALQVVDMVVPMLASQVANEVKDAAISNFTSSMQQMYSGVLSLDQGILNLSNGISEFNTKGISPVTNLFQHSLKTLTDKTKAFVQLGENYQSFSSKKKNTLGETKFIYVIDSQKPEVIIPKSEEEKSKTTFWDRLKNLFR